MTPKFAFCADDFTGATDTLATLSRAGLSARLYLRISDAVEAASSGSLDAVGLATPLRAMAPDDARQMMRDIAPGLALLGAQFVHFKICSTFDSSPQIGNIREVGNILAETLGAEWTVIIGGQPSLGRHCVFGNLFAAAGDGVVHRIDRHPTMSVHPITPMEEADLRLHLARQGWEEVGLIDFTAYAAGPAKLRQTIEARLDRSEKQTLLDVAQDGDLAVIGDALASVGVDRRILLIGASSVAEALFRPSENASAPPALPPLKGPVFGFAGSRSVVTAHQVAKASRFNVLAVDPDDILSENARVTDLRDTCQAHLRAGEHVLVRLSERPNAAAGQALAAATGRFINRVVSDARPGCLAIAGGDTSSAAVECLGIDSISFIADLDRGVPLVRAHSRNAMDSLPMILKGGQVGGEGLFDKLAGLSVNTKQPSPDQFSGR